MLKSAEMQSAKMFHIKFDLNHVSTISMDCVVLKCTPFLNCKLPGHFLVL